VQLQHSDDEINTIFRKFCTSGDMPDVGPNHLCKFWYGKSQGFGIYGARDQSLGYLMSLSCTKHR